MDVLHWPTLLKKDGEDLFDHYRHMLESLAHKPYCRLHPDIELQNFLGRYHTVGIISEVVW